MEVKFHSKDYCKLVKTVEDGLILGLVLNKPTCQYEPFHIFSNIKDAETWASTTIEEDDINFLFSEIELLASQAIDEAQNNKKLFNEACINWGGLYVSNVEWFVDSSGPTGFRVYIGEGQDERGKFQSFVGNYIQKELDYKHSIEVILEW